MIHTVCSRFPALGSLLWSTLLLTAAPALTHAAATAQFRGRPSPARQAPARQAPTPARQAPAPARQAPRGRAALPGRATLAPQIPRHRPFPGNALVPTNPAEASSRARGGNTPTPPSPVTLTLDSITADPEEKAKARKAASEFFALHVKAKDAAPGMRKVAKLRWFKTLAKAEQQAVAKKKPILWIQALGDLKGYT